MCALDVSILALGLRVFDTDPFLVIEALLDGLSLSHTILAFEVAVEGLLLVNSRFG